MVSILIRLIFLSTFILPDFVHTKEIRIMGQTYIKNVYDMAKLGRSNSSETYYVDDEKRVIIYESMEYCIIDTWKKTNKK